MRTAVTKSVLLLGRYAIGFVLPECAAATIIGRLCSAEIHPSLPMAFR
jgi:hypothetical protein